MDYRSRALLVEDGRRFSPTGWFYGIHAPRFLHWEQMAMLPQARAGDSIAMPYLSSYGQGSDPLELGLPFLNASYNRGLRMLFDISDTLTSIINAGDNASKVDALWAVAENAVKAVRQHPALLGYYINDDTIGRPMNLCRRMYLLLRQLDPWHPTFAAIAGSGNAWQYHSTQVDEARGAAGMTYDVGSYEMYIENSPAFEKDTIIEQWPMRWAPQWITGYGGGGPLGSESANRLQGFITAMYGATGSLIWDYWPFTDSAWPWAAASARWANAVIAEFSPQIASPVLNSRRELSVTSPNDAVLAVEHTDESGCTLLLIANTATQPAVFSLASEAGRRWVQQAPDSERVPVLFERRHAVLSAGGELSEAIDGFGTRAIRINCSAKGGGGGPGHGYGDDDFAADDFATDDGGGRGSDNRVYNPSFEDFVVPAQPAGMHLVANCSFDTCSRDGLLTQMTRVVDSTVAHSLGHSLRLTGYANLPGTDPSSVLESMQVLDAGDKNPGGRPLTLGAGSVANCSVWVRAPAFPDGWPGLKLSFYGPGFDSSCEFDLAAMELKPWQWTELQCTRQVRTSGVLSIGVEGAGTVWLDDVSVLVT